MSTEQSTRVPRGGRGVVCGVWAAAALAHLCVVFFGVSAGPVGTVLAIVLAVVGLAGAGLLAVGGRPPVLLVAAAAGLVGVAVFLLPRIFAVPGFGALVGNLSDWWAFGGFLLDGLLVRLAVFTLRRTERAAGAARTG